MAEYQIKKGVLGQKVLYNCPGCGSPLTSSFEKAGTQDACPDCHRPHVIPGAKEKQALEQAVAIKQQQEAESEKKRIEEATRRARVAKEKAAAVAATQSPVPAFTPVAADVPKKSNVRRRRFGDGVLDAAFATTRGFSVFVIFVSLAALVIVGILIMEANSTFKPQITKQIAVPGETEFAAFQKTMAEVRSRSTETTTKAKYADRVVTLLKKLHLDSTSYEQKEVEDSIRALQIKLSPGEFDTFLAAFENFVTKHEDKTLSGRWFCGEYLDNYESRLRDQRDDELFNLRVSGRISGLSTAALATFGGLISFMVLPLLIRIEANTRESGQS